MRKFNFNYIQTRRTTLKSSFLFILISIILLNIVGAVKSPYKEFNSDASIRIKAPPQYIEHLTFGFSDLFADFLWLRLIQDLDVCQTVQASMNSNGSCHLGWSYQMLTAIHKLAPKFRIPMAVGPMSLSIFQNDYKGAEMLFDLAVEAFPNDWPILYRAAYHYLYEGNDRTKAADLLSRAAANGAPSWLNSLAARIYLKNGKLELALSLLQDYRKTLTDPEQQKKVDERIKALQSSLSP